MNYAPAAQPSGRVRSVLVVDDHPLYSDALSAALRLVFSDCTVDAARSLGAALRLIEGGCAPDLVMFDLKLPDVQGISGFETMRERLPDVPILVISSLTSVEIVQALMDMGAAGFLPKDSSATVLKKVLFDIAAGRRHVPPSYQKAVGQGEPGPQQARGRLADLTPQQQRIMKLICSGKANKQIAYELDLAEATVKAHITALLRRLGVQNRTQAAMLVEGSIAAQAGEGEDPDTLAFLSH